MCDDIDLLRSRVFENRLQEFPMPEHVVAVQFSEMIQVSYGILLILILIDSAMELIFYTDDAYQY